MPLAAAGHKRRLAKAGGSRYLASPVLSFPILALAQREFCMSRKSQPVGDGIEAAPEGWSFGGEVWRHFDGHIRRSIPFYDQLHQLIATLATGFSPPQGRLYELGSSTGTLCRALRRALPEAEIIGVDCEQSMVDAARREGGNIDYVCADVCDYPLQPCHFVSLCYCLQFIPLAQRSAVLQAIYQQLEPGGALVLAEKVKRRDANYEDLCRSLLHHFKLAQGHTPEEIAAKDRSLAGVLTPLYEDENQELLQEAGFQQTHLIFRNTAFDAWLAIK